MATVDLPDPPYVYQVRMDWLGQVREEAIDPQVAVVDTHHHFSDRRSHLYLLDELVGDLSTGHKVVATVFLEGRMCDCGADEAMRGVAETGIATALGVLAQERGVPGVAAGIVGNVELTSGARVEESLRAHIAVGGGRFRGVRQIAPWDASPSLMPPGLDIDPNLLASAPFREGFAKLAPLGLSFDAWLYYPQYEALGRLADAFPDTQIILNFPIPLGVGEYTIDGPADVSRWGEAVRTAARHPNIAVKLGGFGIGIAGFRLGERDTPPTSQALAEAIRPFVEPAIEAFGVERCLVGSNFPVDKGSYSYVVFWNAMKRLLHPLTLSERAAILSENARRYYRLP
jgi:predicted TIM-barrel fold metal-dependent hydrolase